MNQVVTFVLGLLIGVGVGFGVWKQPAPATAEYSRAQGVAPEATKITEAKVEPPKPAPEPPKPAAKREPPPKTPIAVKKKAQPGRTPEQLVAAHWAESIDADWSESAVDRLRKDFEKLESTHAFTVQSIDCRKSSCIIVLEWGRKTDAEAAQSELLGAPYALVCSKRLFFPPGRTTSGYQTTLVFYDCGRA